MPDLPYVDTESNVARAAQLMRVFAQEMQDEFERERGEHRVHGGEVQE